VWRGDVLLEGIGLRREGKEVEDPPAVVVQQDDRDVESQALVCEKATEVVGERHVSDEEDDRRALLGGRCPEGGGDGAVDPVGSAVAERARRIGTRGEERLHVAHRH